MKQSAKPEEYRRSCRLIRVTGSSFRDVLLRRNDAVMSDADDVGQSGPSETAFSDSKEVPKTPLSLQNMPKSAGVGLQRVQTSLAGNHTVLAIVPPSVVSDGIPDTPDIPLITTMTERMASSANAKKPLDTRIRKHQSNFKRKQQPPLPTLADFLPVEDALKSIASKLDQIVSVSEGFEEVLPVDAVESDQIENYEDCQGDGFDSVEKV
ncbi:hypothetical protein JCGZ_18249 [Jatropha curcas]|uniref:Uncharacterized protein n=1 Tax=Jatropha curcas TaxID=180498 RepID=A0A067K2S3_JATCU|nr:hypothetical protein JCGZ_18249 [Jatropha curcas]